MNQLDPLLWHRFLKIAQPFFYPLEAGSGKVFLSLLLLLLIFLFAAVFVLVSGVSIVSQYIFPDFFNSIAPGLYKSVASIIYSPSIIIVLLMLLVPMGAFFLYRNQIKIRWQPWAFLSVLLFLSLSVSGLNVIISYVGNFFTTALAEKSQDEFWRFLYVYAGVFVVGTPIVVLYGYTRDRLGNYWRKWLTDEFLDRYLSQRAFYQIESDGKIDNPDQRITEDIKSFTITSLRFLLIILGSIIDVISFTGILFSISKSLSVFLLIYAFIGTLITVVIGRRLIPLNFNQLRREADFRYGLVHVRDNAESIAFYQGEDQELNQVKQRFLKAFENFNLLVGWQRNVNYFTKSYQYAVIILPSLILAPIYFAGTIKYGDITQANFAFAQVLGAFSIIVSEIEILSAFAAGINRLATFSEFLEYPKPVDQGDRQIDLTIDSPLALEHVTLNTPNYQKILVKDLSLTLASGEGLVIMGQSGVGKSSLLRAIAGLWTSGTGRLVRPELSSMLFLPQRPYMILGTLRQQLLYPNINREVNETELRQVLKLVNLEDLPERVNGFDAELDWANILSLGEQQRLAFARLLISKPRYAILDEATSALDLKNEELLYKKLDETETTYISVGHRMSLLRYHQHVLELMGDQKWRLVSTKDYQAEMSLLTQ
ncbi:ABC transporter ATP-binding protein/permease [Planktothrix mougeotii]|uniref:ABC transporter ATP-binding protein/permease n=1 Tax=Planktothrix mougeotii LEGE 06226 TaxID=1828728 RepID=A0ABR9U5X3_9CYAN|nr:ABC transporter ATP-binding protein/permease [Planktothrix mougeotii]MBE9141853.1 ABC transporter ATP-binding protein/permease [Planktothrix mougeotii LEGE 06226]